LGKGFKKRMIGGFEPKRCCNNFKAKPCYRKSGAWMRRATRRARARLTKVSLPIRK